MKSIKNININGMVFSIDVDAFDRLETYLQTLESLLFQKGCSMEVVQDIEARIGELFKEHLGYMHVEVVNLSMVSDIIKTLGSPELIVAETPVNDEEEAIPAEPVAENSQRKDIPKKLYRDIDQQFLFGICSGLAIRLGIDVTVVRILFLASVCFSGFGIILYFVLCLIVPAANTAAKRLEMRGIEPTMENIQKEVERLKQDRIIDPNGGQRSLLAKIVIGFLICFAVIGGIPILFLVAILLGVLVITPSIYIHTPSFLFDTNGMPPLNAETFGLSGTLTFICLMLVFVLPIVGLIYALIRRKGEVREENPRTKKVIWLALLLLWLASFVYLAIHGIRFSYNEWSTDWNDENAQNYYDPNLSTLMPYEFLEQGGF